ncbi:MAG: S1-like domain-containing RNA-binding protein [Desulfobacula sp.]|nr:S1-like domain-containing RNA-binding protein [Desulfobacula sp.]
MGNDSKNMLEIGKFNDLIVDKKVEFGLYLQSDQGNILLPKKYISENVSIGDTLNVFVYTDSEDRLVATTLEPNGVVGDFVFLEAKDVASFGTFMDWGLEKDLLVPKMEQQDRMVPSKKYLTKICFDDTTDRVYGTTKISANCDKDITDLKVGQKVDLLIYSRTTIGINAVINNRYSGMLYINETYQDLSIGDTCTAYIMRLRGDKKIDLTLKKPGYDSVKGSAKTIVSILQKAGGFIPCHDKSSPQEIKKVFSMSKKEFKRAVGGLFKKGVLELKKNGICLKQNKWPEI